MDLEKFKNILKTSEEGDEPFSLDDISSISEKVAMSLEMDRYTQSYFYQITIENLKKSSLNEEDIQNMIKKGWKLLDEKNIFVRNL